MKGSQARTANTFYECFYCNEFWVVKSRYEKHLRVCGKKPGVVYDFDFKNIVTFEDNFKCMGDLPFSVYADFETTAPTDDYLSPENKQIFAVSYSLIFAWHPKLALPRQTVVRGYNHSLDELSHMTYLTSKQLAMRNQRTLHQLRDVIIDVHSRKRKNAIVEMFNIELKFACDILICWFNNKLKKLNLANERVVNYRRCFPVTSETKCAICDFALDVELKGLEYKENKMSYLDFLIRKEYAFIKNIFDEEELKLSKTICNLETYWQKMKLYTHLIKLAEIELKSANIFSDIDDESLQKFLIDYCDAYEHDVAGLVEEEIKKFDVKHNKTTKIPKFTLQLYSFLYDSLMDFPEVKFDEIKTVTAKAFMINLHRIINCKVHIHHSHVTGEIIGYVHDFCNWKIRENKNLIPLIGCNFLGFDIYFMVKGYRSSVWGMNDFKMGGTNLTNMNFANISSQVKIIDTLKYYQTSLANISSTVTVEQKKNIEETVDLYLKNHSYFSNIWQSLDQNNKNKILEIISKGKGAISYEKIVDINSLDIVPEKEFFEYTESYSKLNGCNIPFEIYGDIKFLYETLKMRKLGDMNDLYNMQDVILLCEIIENRFEKMKKKFGFNPRKCNSASTLSGCVQRNQSKVVIALPTYYSHAEIFEKTLIGGFTCVNNRLGFDTEVILPNFDDYSKTDIDESFQAYKDQDYKLGYNIKLDDDELSSQRRVISKIIKFDENNQYGFAMTKPMPVGAIKEKDPSWTEYNILFENVSLDDKKGHIFIVDIEFDYQHATDHQIMYNKIIPPFIEKHTKIEANKRSVYQLLELYSEDKNGNPNKYIKFRQKPTQICFQKSLFHHI